MAIRNSTRKPVIPQEGKHVQRVGAEFDLYYDGSYIGSRPTRLQAEADLDAHVTDLLYDTAIAVADDEACYELEHCAVGAVSLTTDRNGASLCIGNKLVSLSHSELRALRQVLNTPGTRL